MEKQLTVEEKVVEQISSSYKSFGEVCDFLSFLREVCRQPKDVRDSYEIEMISRKLEAWPILEGQNLTNRNLKRLRIIIRRKLVETINIESSKLSYFEVLKFIFALDCISFDIEMSKVPKGLDRTNKKIMFCFGYLTKTGEVTEEDEELFSLLD